MLTNNKRNIKNTITHEPRTLIPDQCITPVILA